MLALKGYYVVIISYNNPHKISILLRKEEYNYANKIEHSDIDLLISTNLRTNRWFQYLASQSNLNITLLSQNCH